MALSEEINKAAPLSSPRARTAFGCSRDFLDNRFIYTVISSRAGGLSVGINVNPDRSCDFDCIYCEVNRKGPPQAESLDVAVMGMELQRTLELIHSGRLQERRGYHTAPPNLLKLRHVALSGDGEPTLSSKFAEAVDAIVHIRAKGTLPFFKLVLITNGTGLDRPEVARALNIFTAQDEVWAKLDAGSQEHMNQVNRAGCTFQHILKNILNLALRRPVVVQSLFPAINGTGPNPLQIEEYVNRLAELKNAGARISLVQVYSAMRPTPAANCGHLPLRTLSTIANRVREATGLRAEVS